MYTGKMVLPFNNLIPEGTTLYRAINTSGSSDDDIKKRLSYVQ